MIFYLVATIRYIRIKQRAIVQQLVKLNTLLAKLGVRANLKKPFKDSAIDAKLLMLNARYRAIRFNTFRVYDEIVGHNHFWRHYLAIYYGSYVVEVCYFSYVFIVASGEEALRLRLLFGTFASEFLALLLWLTAECCAIAHLSGVIHQQQRKCFQLVASASRVGLRQHLQVFMSEWIKLLSELS